MVDPATGYPTGIGSYIRAYNLSRHGTPRQMAKKAADHGLGWVAILAAWQDRRAQHDRSLAYNVGIMPELVAAFDEVDVDPFVWAFPRAGWEDELQAILRAAFASCGDQLMGLLLDPEIYYKFKRGGTPPRSLGMRSTPEAVDDPTAAHGSEDYTRHYARALIRKCLDVLDERHAIGITSYGLPSWHSLAWEDLVCGFGSGQYYRVGRSLCSRGLDEWRALWGEDAYLLPSVGTFGDHNLAERLGWFVDEPNVHGAIAWSWKQTNSREWKILESFADKF